MDMFKVLHQAYIVDQLSTPEMSRRSEALFGSKFSTTKIYFLLKKHGIQLRTKSESVSMASATLPRNVSYMNEGLVEWVDGFLLGDGCINFKKKSFMGARFVMGSTEPQWTEYAIKELTPYCPSKPKPIGEICERRPNKSWESRTLTHPDIVAQAKRWYPKGVKIIPPDVRITPVSLLLWYLGDGSLHNNFSINNTVVRFATCAFTPKDIEDVLLPKLKELGIDCVRTRSKNDVSLKTGSIGRFFEIIGNKSPFEAYQYKFEMPSWLGLKRLRDIVKSPQEKWRAIWHYNQGNVSAQRSPGGRLLLFNDEQAQKLRSLLDDTGHSKSISDVVKTSDERWRARRLIATGKITDSVMNPTEAANLRALLDKGEGSVSEDEVNKEFRKARETGFPYYSFSFEQKIKLWESTVAFMPSSAPFKWDGKGTQLASCFHPHMFECKNKSKKSAIELFNSDEDLKRAIFKALCLEGKITAYTLRDICRRETASSCINNFPPRVAATAIEAISKDNQIDVLDPCAGFSGRMIGCASRKSVRRYVGIDLSPHTANGLIKTSEFLTSAGSKTKIEVIEGDCIAKGASFKDEFDVVFTSPPFLDEEIYKDVPFESDYSKWLKAFVEPFFLMCHSALKPDGQLCLYTRSFILNLKGFNEDAKRIASNTGFTESSGVDFLMPSNENNRGGRASYGIKIFNWKKAK